MKFNPLVSIIIPVYNGSNFLAEAIDSALAQTYTDTEIIIVNDGSTDNGETEKIVLNYGDKVRYFKKANGGVSSALNVGIKKMRGEYFSWLSHDDKYVPEKIEKQVELLSEHRKNYIMAYCASMLIDKDSREIKWRKPRTSLSNKRINKWDESLGLLFKEGTFNGCALMIPKKAFLDAGFFDEKLRFNQDAFMWGKILLKGYGIIYSPYVGVMSRVHSAQLTQRGQRLFHSDCSRMSDFFISVFTKTHQSGEFLYLYAVNNAKYNNADVVRKCINIGKKNKLFSWQQMAYIHGVALYGKIRPAIRRIYHKIFNGIRTQ